MTKVPSHLTKSQFKSETRCNIWAIWVCLLRDFSGEALAEVVKKKAKEERKEFGNYGADLLLNLLKYHQMSEASISV